MFKKDIKMSESPFSPDQQGWAPTPDVIDGNPLDGLVGEELTAQRAQTTQLTRDGERIVLGEGPLVSNFTLEEAGGLKKAPGVELLASVGTTQSSANATYVFKRHGEGGTDLLVVPGQSVAQDLARQDSTLDWRKYLEAGGTKLDGENPTTGINFKANGQPFDRKRDPAHEKAFTVYFDGNKTVVRNRGRFYSTSVTHNLRAEVT